MIKLFSISAVFLGLMGCQSASKPHLAEPVSETEASPSLFFEIRGAAPTGAVTPSYEEKALILGDLEVVNWPSTKLECDSCLVRSGREFHPDGPTQWLKIEGDEQSMLLVSSYQQRDFIDSWHISYQKDALVIEDRETEVKSSVTYDASLPVLIQDTDCELVWLKREVQTPVSEGISNDVAEFKTQFAVQCNK